MLEITAQPPREFVLIGGDLSLDFANTVGGDRASRYTERLKDYLILVAWSRQAGLLSKQQADSLIVAAELHPDQAVSVLERAKALREAIYRIFRSTVEEKSPQEGDLELLNSELSRAAHRLRLTQRSGKYSREWVFVDGALDQMLGPVAQAAADLLTSGDLERVRVCAGDSCGWLFVDHTRNHSRRWCDMKDCGNIAKVRSYRSRKKEKPR